MEIQHRPPGVKKTNFLAQSIDQYIKEVIPKIAKAVDLLFNSPALKQWAKKERHRKRYYRFIARHYEQKSR